MRVLVCGSRDFDDADVIDMVLDALNPSLVIDGAAAGADTLAHEWADDNGITNERYEAEWKQYGNAAGPIRNQRMLDEGKPDVVWAFINKPLTESRGTQHMTSIATKAGIPVYIVEARNT